MKGAAERIRRFNAGREPERLLLKYRRMAKSRAAFLRGTCHLFYEDWPSRSPLNAAPQAWLCGDLHFENFGAYKGDNRAVYFDINDFDEAALAPCTWDLARFLTSILVTARDKQLRSSETRALCALFLSTYGGCLRDGKARWVERETTRKGELVGDLLRQVRKRKRASFLRKYATGRGEHRRLIVSRKRFLPVERADRAAVTSCLGAFARTQPDPKFYRVLDVVRRVAGLGSLGVDRYAILVEGRGSPDGNYLLDLKEARPSALQPYLAVRQPSWKNEADRVVSLQRRIQAISVSRLHAVALRKRWFVLRELQPVRDRIEIGDWRNRSIVAQAVKVMAQVTAWAHLRTGGRQRAAIADSLIEFARDPSWTTPIARHAVAYAERVDRDWRAFRAAFHAGFFREQTAS